MEAATRSETRAITITGEHRAAAGLMPPRPRQDAAVLRAQLQPHFLFNALQAIQTMVHRDAETADAMIVALSDLLRLSMRALEAEEIPLVKELDLLDRYVDVVQPRFGDRLHVSIDAPGDLLDARVPPLLLQPLVENAVRHGLGESGGTIVVQVWREGDYLRVTVADNGRGLRPGAVREGVGIGSVRGRLQALYGDRHDFVLRDNPTGGATVVVTIPFCSGPRRAVA